MTNTFFQKVISFALAGAAATLTVIFTFPRIHYFSFLVGLIAYIFFLWLAQMIIDVLGGLAGGRIGKGVLFGLLISVFILIVGKGFSVLEVSAGLQNIPNFFIAAPIFLLPGLRNASDIVMIISYAFYGMIIGGLFAWLYSLNKPAAPIGMVLLVIGLAVLHYTTMVQIQESLSAALNVLAQIFTGKATWEGN